MALAPIVESTLSYPLDAEPVTGDGSAIVIAPGVLWLRMPLFDSLPWINVWAIAEDGGWSIVDTGLHSTPTIDAWQAAFAGAMGHAPVLRVVVTHMHPDHCGMAGWLAERFEARLWMSRLEYLTCRLMAADTGQMAPNAAIEFYRAAGWDGDTLRMGDHDWTVVVGNGHSPEHVCLYCPDLKLLISGDQVLPRISSNVSVLPIEPDADPLGDWLGSLSKISTRVPDDVLVLPAHNSPFRGLHARIGTLIESHRRALIRLEEVLEEPRRPIDVFAALFFRPITAELLGMATGEAIAHLNHLSRTGRAVREADEHGVWWWRKTGM
jgi:glyoxylase-like metal-dependent hydrolase (beta-lactamase superfamily II)